MPLPAPDHDHSREVRDRFQPAGLTQPSYASHTIQDLHTMPSSGSLLRSRLLRLRTPPTPPNLRPRPPCHRSQQRFHRCHQHRLGMPGRDFGRTTAAHYRERKHRPRRPPTTVSNVDHRVLFFAGWPSVLPTLREQQSWCQSARRCSRGELARGAFSLEGENPLPYNRARFARQCAPRRMRHGVPAPASGSRSRESNRRTSLSLQIQPGLLALLFDFSSLSLRTCHPHRCCRVVRLVVAVSLVALCGRLALLALGCPSSSASGAALLPLPSAFAARSRSSA